MENCIAIRKEKQTNKKQPKLVLLPPSGCPGTNYLSSLNISFCLCEMKMKGSNICKAVSLAADKAEVLHQLCLLALLVHLWLLTEFSSHRHGCSSA